MSLFRSWWICATATLLLVSCAGADADERPKDEARATHAAIEGYCDRLAACDAAAFADEFGTRTSCTAFLMDVVQQSYAPHCSSDVATLVRCAATLSCDALARERSGDDIEGCEAELDVYEACDATQD